MKGFLMLLVVLVASPLWPLGENPTVGDPFVIVNISTNQLAFVHDGEIKKTFAVATGKEEDRTPEGLFTVTVKATEPYYRKKNIEGGAVENPLGSRWIGFDARGSDGRTYGIHGTNQPQSIGQSITAGCVRMANEQVEILYEEVPLGTKVLIVSSGDSFETLARLYGAM
ncbi:L,D-transpeptidase [Halalkalibacterium ligniniphilum]|uniref:L,D-transpeptidase n=1 Tax=Halalkalibacterium ligniniphilum TaxID=1134413 RepID=UPI00034C66CD|nr:L,D-transpeptidase [Halalkalibacterium ligniniphilum]